MAESSQQRERTSRLSQKSNNLIPSVRSNKSCKSNKSGKNFKSNFKSSKMARKNLPESQENGNDEQTLKLKPANGLISASRIYDCCAFIIHCQRHNKVLVYQCEHVVWMPFITMLPNKGWEDNANFGFVLNCSGGDPEKFDNVKNFVPCERYKAMQVLRLQMPQKLNYITRIIYYFSVKEKTDYFQCCTKISANLDWMPLDDIIKGTMANLWGPELVEYCSQVPSGNIKTRIAEYALEEVFLYVPRDPPRNLEEDMLKSLRITDKDVERLYEDFLSHCYPSFYMTIASFRCYMMKYGFEQSGPRLNRLFRAFNYTKTSYLSFHEFLLGLACMEPTIMHGKLRVKFIFRFYSDDFQHLSEENFKQLVIEMSNKNDTSCNESRIARALAAIGEANIKQVDGKKMILERAFIHAVGSHRFRGTSVLCRATKGIFNQVSRSLAAKGLLKPKQSLSNILINRQNQDVCKTCKDKNYDLATHFVLVLSNGQLVSQQLDLNQSIKSESITQLQFSESNYRNQSAPEKEQLVQTAKQYSIEIAFNLKSAANILIQMIREFVKEKGTVRRPNGLMQDRKEDLWKLLLTIYNDINVLLENEEKCQRVYSPCYVIGDIHGNLEDLLSFERSLWKQLPCIGANFLFLGDYVDRGQWGLECSLYLFSFKILCPNKVTLLRGNHEVRSLQSHYTYKRECMMKYGEIYGLKMWELTNRIYDKLPVCALVDDALFCAHGGIPRAAQEIAQICQVKRELKDPEHDSTIAWEILWSDPCHMQQFFEISEFLSMNPHNLNGYVKNTKRGTAWLFNEIGANNFLRQNNLTHIIRAHEVPPLGYMFHFGNKCVTIFSCSHYCGNDNDCACILADSQRMRVIHLDTVNNNSATD